MASAGMASTARFTDSHRVAPPGTYVTACAGMCGSSRACQRAVSVCGRATTNAQPGKASAKACAAIAAIGTPSSGMNCLGIGPPNRVADPAATSITYWRGVSIFILQFTGKITTNFAPPQNRANKPRPPCRNHAHLHTVLQDCSLSLQKHRAFRVFRVFRDLRATIRPTPFSLKTLKHNKRALKAGVGAAVRAGVQKKRGIFGCKRAEMCNFAD